MLVVSRGKQHTKQLDGIKYLLPAQTHFSKISITVIVEWHQPQVPSIGMKFIRIIDHRIIGSIICIFVGMMTLQVKKHVDV